jgi:WD40 repeat protein
VGYDAAHRRVLMRGDAFVAAWQPGGGKPAAAATALRGGESGVAMAAASRDGRLLAACLSNGLIRFWNVAEIDPPPQELWTAQNGTPFVATALGLDGTGKTLAVGTEKGTVLVWHVTGERVLDLPLQFRGYQAIRWIRVSDDGQWLVFACQHLASGSMDGAIHLLHIAQKRLRYEGSRIDCRIPAVFTPNGRLLIDGGQFTGLIDLDRPDPLRPRPQSLRHGMGDMILSLRASPDSHWLATTGTAPTYDVKTWDLQSDDPGSTSVTLMGHSAHVVDTDFSPQSEQLASASRDGTVRVWNLRAPGLQPIVLRGYGNDVGSVHFSADNRWLIAGAPWVQAWNRDLGTLVALARYVAGRQLSKNERLVYLDEKPPVEQPRVPGNMF